MAITAEDVVTRGDAGRKMIRHLVKAVIPANASWPESAGGPVDLPPAFYFLRVDNRSPATGDVLISLDGPIKQAGDVLAYWDRVNAGERRVRNVGTPGVDAPAKELHLFNLGAVQATIWIELAMHPIIDISSSRGATITDGSDNTLDVAISSAAVKDISVYNVETTVALGASATFTGAWRDTLYYNWFAALVLTDVTGTLILDEADAAVPTVANLISSVATAAVPANQPSPPAATGFVARVVPTKTVLRFNRVRYINGAGAQARLNIQSAMSPIN
jgi:hypothetical protein